MDSKLEVFYDKGLRAFSRRNFLAGAGALGATAAVAGCSASGSSTSAVEFSYSDSDVLNFALNLEYLEASYYLFAATGSGLASADTGGGGTVTGGAKVPGLTTAQQAILNEFAYDEQEHVRFLRSALGTSAVKMPNINLTTGFSGFVNLANTDTATVGGIPVTATLPLIPTTFNPFGSFDQWAVGGFVFEDVGVTAYNGALPLFSQAGVTSGYLAAAAGIMAVEAYHAAFFRTYLIQQSIVQTAAVYPYAQYANRLASLRSLLGGGYETLLNYNLGSSTVPVTTTSTAVSPSTVTNGASGTNYLAFARGTTQVLHIVYGTFSPSATAIVDASGITGGGFFPNGLNGNIYITLG